MGGSDYDRPTYSAPVAQSRGSTAFSAAAQTALGQRSLHVDLDPRVKELECKAGTTPIVVAVDVTGSMGNWTKIIWDKLPMFYGQLKMQGYCVEPSMSFAAVGDALTDSAPLQVGNFAQGLEIDNVVGKVWLEGRGGANDKESYDLAAYYYAEHVKVLDAAAKPFFFITGDEGLHGDIQSEKVKSWLPSGDKHVRELTTRQIFQELQQKFHVFHLKKSYHKQDKDVAILEQWADCVGADRILSLTDPKACVDIMLGAIAIVTGSRTLDEYIEDLKERGQDDQRRTEVREALKAVKQHDEGDHFGHQAKKSKPLSDEADSNASTTEPVVEHKVSQCRIDEDGRRWRVCAGAAVLNTHGKLLVGERIKIPGAWNAPQGGVDIGEDISAAAAREAFEECGLRLGRHIALVKVLEPPVRYEATGWLQSAGYAGQELHWTIFRTIESSGDAEPSSITDLNGQNGEQPEFSQVRWASVEDVIAEMWPAKRPAYEALRDGVKGSMSTDNTSA
jgi:8-oxo-dGTP pyrophosphatase MutT (NUDIX family)